MPRLYGKEFTKQELLRYVGDIEQIARAKSYRLTEGFEDGLTGVDVMTGSGLSFSVLPGRGMDISAAHYKGVSLNWRSATSDVHSAYFDHEGEGGRGWLRSFSGGLVATCGLSSVGANGVDGGTALGLHGRIGNTPATNVYHRGFWDKDDYVLEIGGTLRETTVFGENLQLTRVIKTKLGSSSLILEDTIENLGHHPTEMMLLYHINIGFPIVNDHSRLIAPSRTVVPRDEDARQKQTHYAEMQPPEIGYRETCYFHDLIPDAEGFITTAVYNPNMNPDKTTEIEKASMGVYVKWQHDQLPRFTEWKMMSAGAYVVGIEPANCSVLGRAREREAGTLQLLEPGESKAVTLEIGVIEGEEIDHLQKRCRELVG